MSARSQGPAAATQVVLDLSRASEHLLEVTMTFDHDGAAGFECALPDWCPGSYMIRDYARFVRCLAMYDDQGRALPVEKTRKSQWRATATGARQVRVTYQVYGHDLTVRTNHVDGSHAFVHGPATFLYTARTRTRPVHVTVKGQPTWTLDCALSRASQVADGSTQLVAASFDDLFDQPLHAAPPGSLVRRQWTTGTTPFELVVWGGALAGFEYNWDRLAADLDLVCAAHIKRLGDMPAPHYLFVLMLAPDAYGGLEHRNCSINLYNPAALTSKKHYEGLLELLSHEFFHLWNGKRLAPDVLLNFDYQTEGYTKTLWMMEGVTSHFDRWTLRQSGTITVASYLEKLLDDWTRFVATPGRRLQSLEESSFDAWIKLYKPDESNVNTTVSYYLKGGLVIACLDLWLKRLPVPRSMDDVLGHLWRRYGALGQPYPEQLAPDFAEAAGISLDGFFAAYVSGRQDPPLPEELAHLGLVLREVREPGRGGALGITMAGAKIATVLDGSSAQCAGLSPGDELISAAGWRVQSEGDLRAQLAAVGVDGQIEIGFARRGRMGVASCVVQAGPPAKYEIVVLDQPPAAGTAQYQQVFGEPLPPVGTVLASVATLQRWV